MVAGGEWKWEGAGHGDAYVRGKGYRVTDLAAFVHARDEIVEGLMRAPFHNCGTVSQAGDVFECVALLDFSIPSCCSCSFQ